MALSQKEEIKHGEVVGNPTGKNDSNIFMIYEQDGMHGIASQFAQIIAGKRTRVDLYSRPRKFFI